MLLNRIRGVENFPYALTEDHIAVMLCLEEALPAKTISKKARIPTSSTYKLLSQLIQRGIVEKRCVLYSLTRRAKKIVLDLKGWDLDWVFLRKKEGDDRCLRFHNLQGRFIVSEGIPNYQRCLQKYIKIKVGRARKEMGFKLVIDVAKITVYSSTSIMVMFPDILIPDVTINGVGMGYADLGLQIDILAEKLEQAFPGMKIDSFCPFELDSQHIAIKNSRYAKAYFEKTGGFLKREKIITDKSHGYHELEAVHPKTAGEDVEKCIRLEDEFDNTGIITLPERKEMA